MNRETKNVIRNGNKIWKRLHKKYKQQNVASKSFGEQPLPLSLTLSEWFYNRTRFGIQYRMTLDFYSVDNNISFSFSLPLLFRSPWFRFSWHQHKFELNSSWCSWTYSSSAQHRASSIKHLGNSVLVLVLFFCSPCMYYYFVALGRLFKRNRNE